MKVSERYSYEWVDKIPPKTPGIVEILEKIKEESLGPTNRKRAVKFGPNANHGTIAGAIAKHFPNDEWTIVTRQNDKGHAEVFAQYHGAKVK